MGASDELLTSVGGGTNEPTETRGFGRTVGQDAVSVAEMEGPTSARDTPEFVYALGQVQPRFPSLALEREFAQLAAQQQHDGLTDAEVFHAVVADSSNRYLARQMCWIFSIEGLETYLLVPRDPADFGVLVGSLRAGPRPTDIDVVIGLRGPVAPPSACSGLMIPVVIFDQIYSFDVDTFVNSMPRPAKTTVKDFRPTAEALFSRIMQLADNTGTTDEHRALNYLAVRYPRLYAATAEAHARNASLTAVDVRPSRLTGVRNIVDVVLSFTDRQSDVLEQFFVRVDVTEEFPFLVTKLSPFYER